MLGNKLDYSNWLKEKLKDGTAKEFKKGTSKIKFCRLSRLNWQVLQLKTSYTDLLTVDVC